MSHLNNIRLLLVFSILLAGSCMKDPVAPMTVPELELLEYSELKRTSVILKAQPASAGINISGCGFIIGKTYDLGQDAREHAIADYLDGEMTLEVTGLEVGTTYYYKAYITDGKRTVMTATNSFTTLTHSAALISNFKLEGNTLSAMISDNGGRAVSHAGFCWGTSANPDIFDNCAEVSLSGTTFSMTLPDVEINTEYYFRAFADNGINGTNAIAYSSGQVTFRKEEEPQLVLSAPEVVVAQESGTFEIVLQANVEFTVYNPDVDWLHPVETKAVESHKLTYLVDKNDTYDDRYAEIRISAEALGKTVTVPVKQVQKDAIVIAQDSYTVDTAGGTVQFAVNHNVAYDISIQADWIKLVETKALTTDNLTFSVDANTTLDNREGLLEFSSNNGAVKQFVKVFQAQLGAVVISEKEKTISEAGGTFEITIQSNVEYTVSDPDVSWIHFVETKAPVSRTLSYSVDANETYDYRKGHILISAPSLGKTDTVTVSQLQKGAISLAGLSYDLPATGGSVDIDLGRNIELTITSPDWITTNVSTKALSSETLSLFIAENQTEEAREGEVVISSADATLSQTITVTQERGPARISFTDPLVKEILVANYDTNGDGDISYGEAMAVTSFGTHFQNTAIQSFDEFKKFTNITNTDSAFRGCSNLTSISVPESLTSIGNATFFECTSLTSITIPSCVTQIDVDAFKGCTNLTSVLLPDGLTSIRCGAFDGCTQLSGLTIPDNVIDLEMWAFRFCSSITSIKIPSKVTIIDTEVFKGCSSLNSIELPTGLTSIGDGAFEGCMQLLSITIPEDVTAIGARAFRGCISIPSVSLPMKVTTIENSIFESCQKLTTVTIPEGVSIVGANAFTGCENLITITLPESLTSIGVGAFNSTGLTSISIPAGVIYIGDAAFASCSQMTAITLPESMISVGGAAFRACSALTTIAIPSGVTVIEESTFDGCSSLTTVVLPDSVTSIEVDAFKNCTSLTSLTVPSGVTSIGSYAFFCCSSLTSIAIPEGVTSIGASSFSYCSSLSAITIPTGVISIGDNAFFGCSKLASITIPEGVTSIEHNTFWGCTSLISITIPEEVKSIGSYAFYLCSGLTSINIPEKVTSIDGYAFSHCTGLESIRVNPLSFPSLGNSASVFSDTNDCPIYVPAASLESYKTAPGWSEYASRIQAAP